MAHADKPLKAFLGFANYFRRFVQGFARRAAPLYDLWQKNMTFKWSAECRAAFEELRSALVSAPVLTFPKLDGMAPFILHVDASGTGGL